MAFLVRLRPYLPSLTLFECSNFQMFKNTQRTANGQLLFSYASLWAFFFPYFIMAFLTFGIAVPSGLFIPSLVSGAALGRILGQALNSKR